MINNHIFTKKLKLFICLSLMVIIACAWTQETALAQTTIDFAAINPKDWLRQALQWIDSQGAIGAIAFILVYIIATVAFLPGSLLTLGAGVIFDVGLGSLYVFIGATLGATAAFLVGRYLARDWVVKKISGNKKFAAIDKAVGNAGLKIVLLTRLSPIFPFNLLNYAFGITGVSLSDYVIGSIGMIPGTIMYVYIGSLATSLAMLETATPSSNSSIQLAMRIFGFVATVLVTIYITRLAKNALDAEGL
jgi:uncharacterized membrane protein YdjX (TVP38/TMEM64 family)